MQWQGLELLTFKAKKQKISFVVANKRVKDWLKDAESFEYSILNVIFACMDNYKKLCEKEKVKKNDGK